MRNSKQRPSVPTNARLDAGLPPIGGVLGVAKVRKVAREDTYDENVIVRYLKRRVREAGGKCKRLKSAEAGWPDYTCLWSPGIADFIETKRPKRGRFEPLQRETHAMLRGMGFLCEVINTKPAVDRYVEQRTREIRGENDTVDTPDEPSARGTPCTSDRRGSKR